MDTKNIKNTDPRYGFTIEDSNEYNNQIYPLCMYNVSNRSMYSNYSENDENNIAVVQGYDTDDQYDDDQYDDLSADRTTNKKDIVEHCCGLGNSSNPTDFFSNPSGLSSAGLTLCYCMFCCLIMLMLLMKIMKK